MRRGVPADLAHFLLLHGRWHPFLPCWSGEPLKLSTPHEGQVRGLSHQADNLQALKCCVPSLEC